MKKSVILLLSMLTLAATGCKTKQLATVAEGTAEGDRNSKEIIAGHYKNPENYKTLLIKADAAYKDSKQSLGFSTEIRIDKDKRILVMGRYLGFTVAKALITPEEVTYYVTLNNTYFKGNYEVLSRWLGTNLDYNKVQNLLTGEALYDLTKGSYKSSVEDGKYKLTGKESGDIIKEFLFEGSNYLLKKQHIAQGGQQPRSVDVTYPGHTEYPQAIVPVAVKIEAEQKDKVNIDIEYASVKFDEKLSFPYEVPEGYEQIFVE